MRALFASMPDLAKRATAAVIDMSIIGVLCLVLLWAMGLAEPPRINVARVAAALLGLIAAAEMFTGRTVGKSFSGLMVRARTGTRASMPALVVRGVVRLLPVALFLPALFARSPMTNLLWWGGSMTLACCYVATAYLTLMRTQTTPFDSASGTLTFEKPHSAQ